MRALLSISRQDVFDRTGIVLSTLCLIHCTVLPVGLALLPMLGISFASKHLDNDLFHLGMAFVLLGIGSIAFIQGYRRHHRPLPLALGMLGTACLFFGAANPMRSLSEAGEHSVTIMGTLVLLAAHTKNRSGIRLCLDHKHCAHAVD